MRGVFTVLQNVSRSLISGFLATMLGVFVAFWLAGLGEQRALDTATKQRLHLAYLESGYNAVIAKDILDEYAEKNDVKIAVKRLGSTAASAAFQDANVLSLLPNLKVSLLRSYVDAIGDLNQSLEIHRGIVEHFGYKQTVPETISRQDVRSKAAAVFGYVVVLQEELKEYFDKELYDDDEKSAIEKRLKDAAAKALRGEASLSKHK